MDKQINIAFPEKLVVALLIQIIYEKQSRHFVSEFVLCKMLYFCNINIVPQNLQEDIWLKNPKGKKSQMPENLFAASLLERN